MFNPARFSLKKFAKRRRARQGATHKHGDPYDGPMFWVTLAGVIVVALSTAITAYQAVLTRRALEVSLDQQRAWLEIEAKPLVGIILNRDGAEMAVDIHATNVGNVPAVFATARTSLVPIAAGGDGEKAPPSKLEPCERRNRVPVGTTVFPNQTAKLHVDWHDPRRADMARAAAPNGAISFLLLTCVSYRTGGSGLIHQTSAAYLLEDSRSDGTPVDPATFNANGAGVPADKLRLAPFPLLNKAD